MLRTLFLFVLFVIARFGYSDVNYVVSPNLASMSFSVRMEVTNAKELETIRIPAWCPGFYFILDYEKRIFDLNVLNQKGERLRFKRLDSRSIQVSNPLKEPIVLLYRVQGNDTGLGFFRAHLRLNSGFINGPSTFMVAEGHTLERHTLQFRLQTGWDIATAMETDSRGTFFAEGYDEFADHPIQLGRMIRRKFEVQGIPFEAIWVGDPRPYCDIDAETERLKQGSLPALRMFGEAPFKKYLYIIHLEVGDFSGGLEHRASTVIAVANTRQINIETLATHEYFHSWNVKQIRPKILGPFDYSKEQRTPHLWFSEGVTDYYAHLHAYQAGFFVPSQLLTDLTNQIEELQFAKNRLKYTVEEASTMAWENGGFGVGDLSYYTKGLVIGLLFDAAIRTETNGKSSLDDVLRTLYSRNRLPKPGFEDEELKTLIAEVGGEKMKPLYQKMVRSKDELPYELLQGIGLVLIEPDKDYVMPRYTVDRNRKLTNVKLAKIEGGLKDGDELVSARLVNKTSIETTVRRDGVLQTFRSEGRNFRSVDYRLMENPFATEAEHERYQEWLKGSEPFKTPKQPNQSNSPGN